MTIFFFLFLSFRKIFFLLRQYILTVFIEILWLCFERCWLLQVGEFSFIVIRCKLLHNVGDLINLRFISCFNVNSLLLKASQLRNTYQQREAATSSDHHFATYVPQGFSHNNTIGTEHHLMTPNLSATSSSSKALEYSCVPQQEQPFNMDSIW